MIFTALQRKKSHDSRIVFDLLAPIVSHVIPLFARIKKLARLGSVYSVPVTVFFFFLKNILSSMSLARLTPKIGV